MNTRPVGLHASPNHACPDDSAAEAALRVLQDWMASGAGDRDAPDLKARLAELARGGALSRDYPDRFTADADYIAGLPDLQNGPQSLIRGARDGIAHVGISGFRLPKNSGRLLEYMPE